jgi:hypothetical protein
VSAVVDPREPGFSSSFLPMAEPDGPRTAAPRQVGLTGLRVESLVIFVIFGVAFGCLGDWVVTDRHIIGFEDLQRLSNAFSAWHGDPPKLAAIGFVTPPLQTIVLLPFTIISRLATSLVALPIVSAIFGGLTLMALNRLLMRCDLPRWLRYPTLILFALVPTVAFYSANGGAEMISLCLLTAGISTLIAWFRTVDTRFLISSGIAFALAAMADYANIVWLLIAAAMVATVLSRHGADDAEVEGTIITYVAPTLYAVALWCLINWLIVSSPFGWINPGASTTVNVLTSHLAVHGASVAHAFGDSLRLALNAAPLALVITPALILTAAIQRNEMAGWLAVFAVAAIFRPGAEALIHANIADIQMDLSPPQLLMAVAGGAWLYQSFPDARGPVAGALMIGLLATVVVVWHGMATYPFQNGEQAFHTAVSHSDRTVTTSRGGVSVGDAEELQMGRYIRAHVHADTSVLTDESQTYGVILLSDDSKVFRTRLNVGAGVHWSQEIRTVPAGVRYLLIADQDPKDAIHSAYPGAGNGHRAGLTVAYQNGRYALIKIAPGTTLTTGTG